MNTRKESFPDDLSAALRRGRLTRRHMLWLMAAAGGGVVTGCAVNPATGRRQLMLMTTSQELELDSQHSPHQFSADYGALQDQALNDYIAETGKQIAEISHRPDMPYSFRGVNANYINAYAFPGGSIAITRGMLLEMENESQMAGLLGHEVAHVTARHTAQRMTQHMVTGLLLAGAGAILADRAGDQEAALAMGLGGIATGVLLASYSRGDEREADRFGMDYMVEAGHNPEGMAGLMEVLRRQAPERGSMLQQIFATHPMSDERYETARQRITEEYAQYRDQPLGRERYMDQTASLRRLEPAIRLQQDGEAALMRERYDQAESSLKEAAEKAPEDYTGLVLLGKTLMVQERHGEARRWLDQAMEVYPEEAQAHHLAGVSALHDDEPRAALERFRHYREILPGNPNTDFFIGLSHERLGEREQAARAYRRFLDTGVSGPQAEYARERLVEWGVG